MELLSGMLGIGCYFYVAVMFGRASWKAYNNLGRVLADALFWPIMGWKAIENLYNA